MSDEELKKRLDRIDDSIAGIVMLLAVIGILVIGIIVTVGMK